MKHAPCLLLVLFSCASIGLVATAAGGPPADAPVYELRVYHCNPGKLPALQARFRDHTMALLEKHGMTNVGYWVPIDEAQGKAEKLIYLLAHRSRDAAKASWEAFGADPEWRKAKAASEADGTALVQKVTATYLDATDYSDDPTALPKAKAPRVFELRTYTASPGKLADLHKRFRDHTTKLFAKHGMTNVFYGVPRDKEPGRDDTLVYLLAFPSREAAAEAWRGFLDDPQWQRVYKASQADGVELAAKIESIYLAPADFSPIK